MEMGRDGPEEGCRRDVRCWETTWKMCERISFGRVES